MPGLGTIVNIAAVLLGATVGLVVKGGLKERFQHTLMSAIGLATCFIGIGGVVTAMVVTESDGTFSTQYVMLMILCLAGGALLGEWIDIEKRLDGLGEKIKGRIKLGGDGKATFVEAFVSSSLLFCVGAMTIVGAIEDGLNHNYTTLFAKSVMDGISAAVFAASLGYGVYFSCFTLLIYQGGLTALAFVIKPYLNDTLITQMSLVGSVLIFALGLNLVLGKKVKVANLLPAMLLPPLLYYLQQAWFAIIGG